MNTDTKLLVISLFNNEKDRQPLKRELTWEQIATTYFSKFATRSQKGGLAFAPVGYRPGTTRGGGNVDRIYCAVFDVEHHGGFDRVKPVLDGFDYVCHSSFSHTVGHPRYRIVLPLDEPVSAAGWPQVWQRLNLWIGGINDQATKDASRIYYLPSHPPGAEGHFIVRDQGRRLSVKDLPEKVDASAGRSFLPSSAASSIELSPADGLGRVVERCRFMSWVSRPEVQPGVGRDLWRSMITNAARFEDSETWIHWASRSHPEYDEAQVEREIESARNFAGGPVTCGSIRQAGFNGCPSGGCATISGKVTKAPAGLWLPAELGTVTSAIESGTTTAYAGLSAPRSVLDFLEAVYPDGLAYINEDFLSYKTGYWRVLEERGEFRNSVARYLGSAVYKPDQINNLVSLVKDFVASPSEKAEPDRNYICLASGTLNTLTCELEDHRPDRWLRCKLPVQWREEATCSRWESFLEEIFAPDFDRKEKIEFLQEWFGYCLTPDSSQHKFVWCVGSGGNGKSVALFVLTSLLGRENVSHAHLERLDRPATRAELENKLVNISSEMSSEATVADGYLKAIVSGDMLEAEKKFKPPYSFKPFVRIVGATNHLPRLRDLSEGFFRRAIILNFNRRFTEEEQDRNLEARLAAELDGILIWAVKGLRRLRERGRFSIPPSSVAAVDAYKRESDTVGMFTEECVLASEGAGLRASVIYGAYADWCEAYGFRAKSNVQFGKRMAELGFEQFRVAAGKCWRVREVPGNEFLNRFSEHEPLE